MGGEFVFDFDCARRADFPIGELAIEVAPEVLQLGAKVWGDRAVRYDLDLDGSPEYFVPVLCGASGNCDWSLFRISPAVNLGSLAGFRFYVERDTPWPRITTYERHGAGQGEIREYELTEGRYSVASRRVVEGEENDRFLERRGNPLCRE